MNQLKKLQSVAENIKVGHVLSVIVIMNILMVDLLLFSSYRKISTIFNENETLLRAFSSIDFDENAIGLSRIFEHELPPSYLRTIHKAYASLITQIHRLRVFDNQVLFDTSTNMETSIILSRIAARHLPIRRLVVDVGAMDGVTGSNSFNYIALGWDAVLIEPYPEHVRSIERNLDVYIKRLYQNVSVVEGVVSEYDGTRMMSVSSDNSKTSSTIVPKYGSGDSIMWVKSYTAKTLGEMFRIPTDFGVLTVDAEGFDVTIVYQFIKDGFRPSFIILETRLLPNDQNDAFLSSYGYNCIARVGSNVIWEHV